MSSKAAIIIWRRLRAYRARTEPIHSLTTDFDQALVFTQRHQPKANISESCNCAREPQAVCLATGGTHSFTHPVVDTVDSDFHLLKVGQVSLYTV